MSYLEANAISGGVSAPLTITNGGMQFVPQITTEPQVIYLDFDGELTSYNGEILTVENVNVQKSGCNEEFISLVVDQLNEIYSGELFFTDIEPLNGEYSTIYVGKSDFLAEYTTIQGISETIDVGNKIKNDNAFVFLDSSADIGYTTHVIAHEIGHIVYGDTHTGEQKNPYNQTASFQYYSAIGNSLTENSISVQTENLQLKTLQLVIDPAIAEYCYVMSLLSDLTQLYNEYYQLVYNQQYYQGIYAYELMAYKNNNPGANVVVNNWQVAGGTRQVLTNGAIASLCYILGVQSVSFRGSSNQCAAMNGGSIQLWGGTATNNYISGPNASLAIMRNDGYASNNVIDGGVMKMQLYGGSALNTVVKNKGRIDLIHNLGGHAYLTDTYVDSGCTITVKHEFDQVNGITTGTHQIRLFGTTYLAGNMIFSSYTQKGETDVSLSRDYRIENCGNFILGADSRTPYDDVMISNMNNIYATIGYDFSTNKTTGGRFSVAVSSDMQCGQYRLAGHAEEYYNEKRMYILHVDTGEEYFHTYGSLLKLGNKTYTIDLNSSNELCLTVKNAESNPDLQISSLTVSSTDIQPGKSLSLQFTIANKESSNAGMSVVGIYDGTQLLHRINVASLAAGATQSYTYTVNTEKMTTGTHNFRVVADIDNQIKESNEENNSKSTSVQITAPLNVDLVPYKPVDSDDILVISTETGTHKDASAITTEDKIYIDWNVTNQGKDSIVGDFYTALYLDDKFVTKWVTGELRSHYYCHIHDYELEPLSAGEHTLKIVTDYYDTIVETSESNNTYTKTFTVVSPGTTSSGGIVSSGGISSGGIVSSGGTSSGGIVSSDGTSSSVQIYSSSILTSQGNLINNAFISGANCSMHISYGGIANSTKITGSGSVVVSSGGLINEAVVYNTIQTTSFGLTYAVPGYLYVQSGGIAQKTTVSGVAWGSGCFIIDQGGCAIQTEIKSGGKMIISSGGVHKGSLQIESGANVSAYTGSIIDFTLSDRAVKDDYLINNLSRLSGTPTYTITVSADQTDGEYKLAQGAGSFTGSITVTTDTGTDLGTLSVGEKLTVNGDTYALSRENGALHFYVNPIVSSGGTSSGGVVSSGGIVSSGGTSSGGIVSSGGTSSGGIVSSGGSSSGGIVSSGGTSSGGIVSSGGTSSGGIVSSGGTSSSVQIYSSSILTSQGNLINNAFISGANCSMHISYGGIANSTKITGSGSVVVSSGGLINEAVVYNTIQTTSFGLTYAVPGYLYVQSGGIAQKTTVSGVAWGSGCFIIDQGGCAIQTEIKSGGEMIISSGGVHKGSLQIESGANVSAYTGSIIDFTLSDRTVKDDYLINDLSLISGSPTYTITVSTNQADGMYKLAQGAGSFTGSITVTTNTGTDLGTLSVGGKLTANGDTYALSKENGALHLYVNTPVSSGTTSSGGIVSSGGTSSGGIVSSGGTSSGGIVSSGGTSSGGIVSSGGTSSGGIVSSGGTSSGGIVSSGGTSSGGIVSSGGTSSGGIVVGSGKNVYVYSGQVITSATINKGGNVILSSGGAANITTINSSGGLHVYSGATASNTTVKQSGYLGVGLGATTYNTTIDYAGELTVWGGGKVYNNTSNQYGAIILSSGAVADSSVINSQGGLHVYSGAVASNTTVKQKGIFGVGLGATTYNTTIDYAGELKVWGGGKVYGNTINEYGAIILLSGAMADTTTINSQGGLHVYSGAVASNTTVKQGGFFGVGDGATTYNTLIDYAGELTVWGGGLVNDNEINQWGAIILSSGAAANRTIINPDGGLHIYNGATAYTTEVTSGAKLGIGSGGYLYGSELDNTGTMTFYEGAKMGGWHSFEGSVITSGGVDASGAYVHFELDDRSASQGVILDNIGNLYSVERYSMEVDADQVGTFQLASGASSFNSRITLYVEDGVDCGSLAVGESLDYNGRKYSLENSNGTLALKIS